MWTKIKDAFYGSETIFWARLQTVLGAFAVGLTYIDPALLKPVLGDNTLGFALFMLGNGVATEYLRRRREPGM